MKKIKILLAAAVVLMLASCGGEKVTVNFDEIELGNNGYSCSQSFISEGLEFNNSYNAEWQSWAGFAVSSQVDVETPGWANQYSVYAGKALSGKNFAVAYYGSFTPTISSKIGDVEFKSMYICLNTYTALSLLNGDNYSKKFEDGDWFKLTITGTNNDGSSSSSIDVYLADFRDGKTDMITEWTKVDLSSLGKCSKLELEFASTDVGEWGMNTPAYVCIDNIVYATSSKID